jgi:hypothetical protein
MPPTAIVRMICAADFSSHHRRPRRFTDLSRDEVSDALQIRMDAASALIVIGHLIGSSETQGAGIVDETPMPPRAATFPMVDLH